MPCSPPRPTFSGGTGAFHSDHFQSDYVTAPVLGAADVPNANFTNVFLWPDPGSETWDAHTGPLGAPSMATIDGMTQALVCSSYFDLLTQYNVNPPTFSGDEITFQQPCVNNALADAASHSGVISWLGMGTFASCIHDLNTDNNSDQINIFLSPDLKASIILQDGNDMCSQGTGGYHGGFAGFPSWTVVSTACNSGAANVLSVESHEMVELISDPAAFGWKHDNTPDFNNTYTNGELGDICSKRGEFTAQPTAFPPPAAGGPPGLVGPYWSDQDAKCEPQFIMNDTIVPMFSTPPFSFPGQLTVPVSQSAGVIQALELEIATGSEDLSGKSAFQVTVDTMQGDHFLTGAVNQGTQWGSNTLHAALLNLPSGVKVSDIVSLTITETSETWDVAGVSLQAFVPPSPPPCTTYPVTVMNTTATHTLSDGTQGIKRMTGGGLRDFATSVTVPAVDANLKVTDLTIQVGTGGDNLDGGRKPTQNADVVAHLVSGRTPTFPDVNRSAEWANNTPSQAIDLLTMGALPPSTVAGELTSIDIVTNFPGGLSAINWDITSVTVTISLGCARSTAPTFQDITLLNLNPGNSLPDGSTGLCRETGNVHGCGNGGSPPLTIPAVPPSQASDIVTSFQMTITTGQDDLRCCDSPGNNANVVINSSNVSTPSLIFLDVNDSLHFDNGVQFSFPLFSGLPDPAGATALTLGQLQTLDIQTNFGGVQNDNWDIESVVLTATVAVGSCCGAVVPGTVHGVAGSATGHTASQSRPAGSASRTATAAPGPLAATPVPHWVVKASPNQGSVDNQLNGVACALPSNCVAVGGYGSGGTTTALIETWNGAQWSIASTPSLGSPFSILNGVSCSGPSFCLAVGLVSAGGSEGGTFQPLAEAWNGSTWAVVSPPVSSNSSGFKAVFCKAVNRCMAVGFTNLLNLSQTLVESWNGGAWSIVPTPNRPGDNALEGVSCWSTTKCMAVGVSGQGGIEQTLTLEANGSPWAIVASPNQGAANNVLYSVSCTGATNCHAVGVFELTTPTSAPHTRQTLVESWNGSAWTIASSPNPGAGGDALADVVCKSTTSCVAGGSQSDGSVKRTLVQTWNGSAWATSTTPNLSATSNVLLGVACSMLMSCDAVGAYQNSGGVEQTLTLQGAKAVLSKVTFSGAPGAPNLTLAGTSFGSAAPASTPAGCGNTGSDYSKDALYVLDLTGAGWEAGITGDCIGLVVGTYSGKAITTGFGSGYNQPPTSHTLNVGDEFVITVLGSTCAGSVANGTVVCT